MKLSEERRIRLLNEVKFSANRSSGPGGQSVNKVNSRIELRFSISKSTELSDSEKYILSSKLRNRINSEGELILTAQTERSQLANKDRVSELFFTLLEKSLKVPKRRKKTLPTKTSRLKRLESKKITGQKKKLRKPPEI